MEVLLSELQLQVGLHEKKQDELRADLISVRWTLQFSVRTQFLHECAHIALDLGKFQQERIVAF